MPSLLTNGAAASAIIHAGRTRETPRLGGLADLKSSQNLQLNCPGHHNPTQCPQVKVGVGIRSNQRGGKEGREWGRGGGSTFVALVQDLVIFCCPLPHPSCLCRTPSQHPPPFPYPCPCPSPHLPHHPPSVLQRLRGAAGQIPRARWMGAVQRLSRSRYGVAAGRGRNLGLWKQMTSPCHDRCRLWAGRGSSLGQSAQHAGESGSHHHHHLLLLHAGESGGRVVL